MKTSFILSIGILYLLYKISNRLIDIYEYKIQHTKREDRWQW